MAPAKCPAVDNNTELGSCKEQKMPLQDCYWMKGRVVFRLHPSNNTIGWIPRSKQSDKSLPNSLPVRCLKAPCHLYIHNVVSYLNTLDFSLNTYVLFTLLDKIPDELNR